MTSSSSAGSLYNSLIIKGPLISTGFSKPKIIHSSPLCFPISTFTHCTPLFDQQFYFIHSGRRIMYRPAREHPSFSSSLLDQIYRSIDERDHQDSIVYTKTTKEVRSDVDFKRISQRSVNSSSSSSDSSSGGGFSSSELESVYGVSLRPKSFRTSTNECITKEKRTNMYGRMYQFEDLESKQKHEGKLVKSKSRAMKIYGNLKKVKQPISPGGRLVTFLHSLFITGNVKNTKDSSFSAACYDDDGRSLVNRRSKSISGSTCSSASSFSRSCISNIPSSRGDESARFVPVSVIVGDDCQPYGDELNLHALIFGKNPSNYEFRIHSSEKTSSTGEAPRNYLTNYQKKVECEFDSIKGNNEMYLNYEVDDDDDAASHASSDLFELENFSAIGMENYGDELPVFETTHLTKNLAIGNGFFM